MVTHSVSWWPKKKGRPLKARSGPRIAAGSPITVAGRARPMQPRLTSRFGLRKAGPRRFWFPSRACPLLPRLRTLVGAIAWRGHLIGDSYLLFEKGPKQPWRKPARRPRASWGSRLRREAFG